MFDSNKICLNQINIFLGGTCLLCRKFAVWKKVPHALTQGDSYDASDFGVLHL